jgi:hypothetical protein
MSLEQKLKSNFSAVKYDDEVAYDSPPQSAPRPQVANRIASRPSSNIIGVALEPEKPKVALRNFFPENWLFELINVNEETLNRCNLYLKIINIFLLIPILASRHPHTQSPPGLERQFA